MKTGRLLSGLLAGLAVCSMLAATVYAGTPAVTAGTIDPAKKTSLTIVKLKENDGRTAEGSGLEITSEGMVGMKGIRFDAVRIADLVTVAGKNGTGTYFANADEAFLAFAAENHVAVGTVSIGGKPYYTTQAMLDAVAAINAITGEKPGEVLMREFAASHAKHVSFEATDAGGKTVRTGMEQGLYLVAETDYSGYEPSPAADPDVHTGTSSKEAVYSPSVPFLVSLPMTNQAVIGDAAPQTAWQYDVTVYPKNQTAVIPKYIVNEEDGNTLQQSEDFEIGETVTQVIAPSAPAVIHQHFYEKYVIRDTMDPGLAFSKIVDVRLGSKVVNPEKKSDFSGFEVLAGGTDYAVSVSADKRSFEVSMLSSGLAKLNALNANGQVAVTFESVLTKDAEDGKGKAARNKPELIWKNRNTEEAVIEGNRPEIYTYRIDLQKIGLTDASKASFTVSGSSGALAFVQEEKGVYHVFDHLGDSTSAKTSVLEPAKTGTLTIRGADAGTYTFTERSTEEGKELLKSSFTVTLTPNRPADGALKEALLTIDGKTAALDVSSGTVRFTIENFPKITLRTGGSGTGLIYGGAAVSLVLALAACRTGKKKRNA